MTISYELAVETLDIFFPERRKISIAKLKKMHDTEILKYLKDSDADKPEERTESIRKYFL